MTKTAAKK